MSEENLVRQCAPTLAGIKTGTIFPAPFTSLAELTAEIRELNRILVPKGLRLLPLRYQDHTALLYLYRPAELRVDLKDQLAEALLADAGYVDFNYFSQLSEHGGSFIVRGGKNLNPVIIEARNGQGRLLPKLAGLKLKEIDRKTNRSEVLDLKIKRGADEFRLVRRWFAEEKRFCIWVTNLPATEWSADEIMMIYRCRWQVELLFKELKSDTNWRRFATSQQAIMEGLVWASLLALIIRRYIAMQSLSSASVYKAGKNVDVWLLPILEAYIHQAWSEITVRLEWALLYISKNAKKAQQRKSKKTRTLDGIFERLSS